MMFWFSYFWGQIIHVVVKGYFIVDATNNQVSTWRTFFRVNWAPLLVRFAVATAIFKWWFDDPALADRFFDVVGNQFSPGFLHDMIVGIHFPLNVGTAFIYAWAVDSGLDKAVALIPWLKRAVPSFKGENL